VLVTYAGFQEFVGGRDAVVQNSNKCTIAIAIAIWNAPGFIGAN
jgi:hypothetical protein